MVFSYILAFVFSLIALVVVGIVLAALKIFSDFLLELYRDEKYLETVLIAVVFFLLTVGTLMLGPLFYNNFYQHSEEISK